jgi:hypothetical protein
MTDEGSEREPADTPLEEGGSIVPSLGQEAGDTPSERKPPARKPKRKSPYQSSRSSTSAQKPRSRKQAKPEQVEQATVIESDLQVSMTTQVEDRPEEASEEPSADSLATVTKLPVTPAPSRERSTLMERLEKLERGLAEVDARLDLIIPPEVRVVEIPPDMEEVPVSDEVVPEPDPGPAPMTEVEMQDVFLGLQRMVAERMDDADRKPR